MMQDGKPQKKWIYSNRELEKTVLFGYNDQISYGAGDKRHMR